jgi:uncharacterized protein YwqG
LFLESETLQAVDLLLETYRRPAVMLHRLYPPTNSLPTRSRLGGLPLLPDAIEWPRAFDGELPLHFLAQIDCAELPRIDPRIPTTGMMFFFGRDDEEQIWSDGKPRDGVRVIYAPTVPKDQKERSPPADLPPICGDYASLNRPWLLPDEIGPSVHASWPLALLRIENWPDLEAIYETEAYAQALGARDRKEFNALYERRLTALRVGAVISATELPTRSEVLSPDWGKTVLRSDNETHFVLPADYSRDAKPFPQAGIMIDRIARLVVKKAMSYLASRSYQQDQAAREKFANAETSGRHWIDRAKEIGLDAVPSEADVESFTVWLNDLATDIPAPPPQVKRPSVLKAALSNIFTEALSSSVTFAAGSPRAAALIPPYFYNVFANEHLPYDQAKTGPYLNWADGSLRAWHHQMLGHAPSCQAADPVSDEEVLLLQLRSDQGVEMMFGDVGEASFWIKADDLRALNFDNVRGEVVGH